MVKKGLTAMDRFIFSEYQITEGLPQGEMY